MTIFDILKSLLVKDKIELNCDEESQFSSFMVNRWLSFYSPEVASYINAFCNTYQGNQNSKQDQFNYIFHVVPKLKFKRLEYVKKVKKEPKEKEAVLIPEFLSQREYKNIVEFSEHIVNTGYGASIN